MYSTLFTHKKRLVIVGGVGIGVMGLLIFHAGTVVGYRQAMYHYAIEKGPHGSRMAIPALGEFNAPHGFIPSEHGALGVITSISFPKIIVLSRDGSSKSIVVSTDTPVMKDGIRGTRELLTLGATIISIGDPDDSDDIGEVDARIIRVVSDAPNMPVRP